MILVSRGLGIKILVFNQTLLKEGVINFVSIEIKIPIDSSYIKG